MPLMVSISGVRGIVGESLTPESIIKYTSAFAAYCNRGKIVIGRDGRITGKVIGNIVSSTLLSMGCDVIALGITPTPTVQIAVEHLRAAGGIAITASHNPIEWNGLKFLGPSGMFLDGEENNRFWALAESGNHHYMPWNRHGRFISDGTYILQHSDMVLHLPFIDVPRLKERKFKVVVDCINSAGGLIVPQLLREMGCDVVEMNCEVSGVFARTPEPLPENLGALAARVLAEHADLGIAVDPDVDRLVLITEKGEPFGEEYTVTTVVKFILDHRAAFERTEPLVVVNLSTTRAVDDIARLYDVPVIRTPVGEINVAGRMKTLNALVGGEGSGGVILPAVHYGRDAIVGIAIILQQLAEFGGTLSMLKANLPQYIIVKEKLTLERPISDATLEQLARTSGGGSINTDDGVKVSFADSWVHLRKSNTEPIIRIIAEAPTARQSQGLAQQFKDIILTHQNSA